MEGHQDELAKQEQSALLSYYKGEKEPETKNEGTEEAGLVDGVPVGPGDVVGAPVARTPWSSGLLGCFGRNDEFLSSDLEVCCLGTFAPCVLYGSNVERLYPSQGLFANHCLVYSSLYFLGQVMFNGNCLAPCFSYPSRTALRRKFNLLGNGEWMSNTFGCCTSRMESEEQRESCESVCDFGLHFLCHPCSLCQEAREVRRRVPHPGFFSTPYVPLSPPSEQAMSAR
eukprot:TRINITY_DN1061_c0_g1_i1.p1 TRINITY_DN1061_c0_g1~~TRINITY_DN1061_c0_g1_i1.p1  ORF type:complete len:227 (-),score=20.38 TRINITY_DN1061_c0_g1_i1:371-1051(-)